MIFAPCRAMLSFKSCTAFSLPGTMEAERSTVSFSERRSCLWLLLASRVSAANSSPCAPVASTMIRSGRDADINVVFHAPAFYHHLLVAFFCCLNDFGDAGDVGRKHAYHDARFRRPDDFHEVFADNPLRCGKPRVFDVR